MIFVEPTEVYACRSLATFFPASAKFKKKNVSLRQEDGPLAYADGWDERILAYLVGRSGEPVLIMSIPSQLRKLVRHRDKQHKEELKRDVLLRIGALIRAGAIIRISRKYVIAVQNLW
jgi:hypothetical protein